MQESTSPPPGSSGSPMPDHTAESDGHEEAELLALLHAISPAFAGRGAPTKVAGGGSAEAAAVNLAPASSAETTGGGLWRPPLPDLETEEIMEEITEDEDSSSPRPEGRFVAWEEGPAQLSDAIPAEDASPAEGGKRAAAAPDALSPMIMRSPPRPTSATVERLHSGGRATAKAKSPSQTPPSAAPAPQATKPPLPWEARGFLAKGGGRKWAQQVKGEVTMAQSASLLATAASFEARLASARSSAKAAVFVHKPALIPLLLHEDVVSAAQVSCGNEARVKLGGKQRVTHVTVHAIDELALDRALVALLLRMSERGAIGLEVEVRWLLREPLLGSEELLERWRRATIAFRSRFPIRKLEAELQAASSPGAVVSLNVHSDGWEEWEAAQPDGSTAEGAKGAAVPFAVAWLLGHVRYGLIPRVHCRPLTQAQSAVLMHEPVVLAGGMLLPGREQSARLRALSAESAALLMLLPPIGDADAPPRLLLCGPRCTVMHALSLLKACDQHQQFGMLPRQQRVESF